MRASSLDWTIFRPSVIFGRDDRFLNMFATLLKLLPVIFLGRPDARFQPVYVEDVAAALVRSLDDRDAYGKTYDLCGPHVYTLRELVALVGELTGHRRPIIGLGDTLSYLQALVLEFLPGKLMTRDNYHSMKVDNVSERAVSVRHRADGARGRGADLARGRVAARALPRLSRACAPRVSNGAAVHGAIHARHRQQSVLVVVAAAVAC